MGLIDEITELKEEVERLKKKAIDTCDEIMEEIMYIEERLEEGPIGEIMDLKRKIDALNEKIEKAWDEIMEKIGYIEESLECLEEKIEELKHEE